MADDESTEDPGGDDAEGAKESLGEKLHHAEHSVEQKLKDTLTAAEIRMIQAGEAETSGSPEVNFASAIEVALNPPHIDQDDDPEDGAAPKKKAPNPADAGDSPAAEVRDRETKPGT